MSLDKCIHPCHHHHIKDIKHFHHPQSPLSLLSQLIPLSYPLNQWSATYHRLDYFSRVSNKCNHTVYILLSGFFWVIIHVSLYQFFIFLIGKCSSLYKYTTSPLSISVQFSHSVVSDSLWPRGLQQARPPCPSPAPGVYTNSCPLSQWCHPTISSSVVPFSSHLQSFPASGSFQRSQLFAGSGGQNIGVSASASFLPMNIQHWSPLGWTGWMSLQSKRLSRVFSNTTVQKHQFFVAQLSL